jgi:hypothetical protein
VGIIVCAVKHKLISPSLLPHDMYPILHHRERGDGAFILNINNNNNNNNNKNQ